MRRLVPCVLLVAAFVLAGSGRAVAHPAPFSFVDVRLASLEGGAPELDVTVVVHVWDVAYEFDLDDPALALNPDILRPRGDRLAAIITERLRMLVDGQPITLDGWSDPEPLRERQSVRLRARHRLDDRPGSVEVSTQLFPYDPNHQTFLNVYEDAELMTQAILGGEDTSYEYFTGTRQGVWAVMQRFVPSGVHHILIGPDHILFLIGLLLLGGRVRQLVLVVTAFTIAHSVTLTLAVLEIMTPSARMVEPIIALSIVYVGLDNLLSRGGKDMRVWIALVFGLIHGFGFASVLREMGLPTGAIGWSLFSFNLGVEVGQLTIVVVVAALLGAIRARSPIAGRRLMVAGSVAVALAGAFWFVERVFLSGGIV
ncbi:MAG: HupE/UreJ family protein [Acidobacteria bacterium]|nr:HupE/UreJ family protein [Acidobacteriota bacterium]MYD71608.1 HupE/UreJ family protein [Acidobacteriota bacterium]MYJ04391.1 HupE/UreJ family protein [Acidobacteriota bacterium]